MNEAWPQSVCIKDFDCAQAFLGSQITLFVEVAEVIQVQRKDAGNFERSKWRLILPLTAAMRSGQASL